MAETIEYYTTSSDRAIWHLLHTVWGGAVLALPALAALPLIKGEFDPYYYLNLAVSSLALSPIALGAALLRLPFMTPLFRRARATRTGWARWLWLLLGTGLLVEFLSLLFAVVFAKMMTQNNSLDSYLTEFRIWLRFAFFISLPWLLSALLAAVYVTRDWLRASAPTSPVTSSR